MKIKSIMIPGVASVLMLTLGCGGEKKGNTGTNRTSTEEVVEEGDGGLQTLEPSTLIPTGDPGKDWIFAQQAVDAWLYFNLSDFKSYEPLIRSNDYDSIRDVFTHHLRFRYMNEQGGMVTVDKDFEVDLNHKGENGNPFYVKEIR